MNGPTTEELARWHSMHCFAPHCECVDECKTAEAAAQLRQLAAQQFAKDAVVGQLRAERNALRERCHELTRALADARGVGYEEQP